MQEKVQWVYRFWKLSAAERERVDSEQGAAHCFLVALLGHAHLRRGRGEKATNKTTLKSYLELGSSDYFGYFYRLFGGELCVRTMSTIGGRAPISMRACLMGQGSGSPVATPKS